jgi:pimeloyl-ACP methyl ester carboxylesterase
MTISRSRTAIAGFAIFALAAVPCLRSQSLPSNADQRFAGKLTSCTVPGVEEKVLCGHYDVFEDRVARRGRTIALNIVLLPATTDSVLRDPLVFLAGGGVVPATRYARMFASAMPRLRRNRDVLLVDQRGSGGSNGLACDRGAMDGATSLDREARYLQLIARCRDALASRADVRFYTTTPAMDDLDDVREWLGFPTLNLFGVSYGTSAAQVYVRQHPTRVRTIVAHGLVPLDAPTAVDLARSAQQSLDALLTLCRRDARCHAAFPDLDAEASRVMAPSSLSESRLARAAVNDLLASAATMREIPRVIHGLARGDSSVLAPPEPPPGAGGAGAAPPPPAGPPLGVRLAILCSEGLGRIDTASIATRTANTFLGDFPVRYQMRWCEGWPRVDLPVSFWSPVVSDTPILLLNGELDAITPPAYARHVAAGFARSQIVLLANQSHDERSPCIFGMAESFVIGGGHSKIDASCAARTPPIEFATTR